MAGWVSLIGAGRMSGKGRSDEELKDPKPCDWERRFRLSRGVEDQGCERGTFKM